MPYASGECPPVVRSAVRSKRLFITSTLDASTSVEALIDAVRLALGSCSWQGIMRPEIIPGAIGRDTKVIGAAYLPLHANFAPGVESFLKPRQ